MSVPEWGCGCRLDRAREESFGAALIASILGITIWMWNLMKTRCDLLKAVNDELRQGLNLRQDVQEETVLSEIGVNSMQIIALAIAMKQKHGLSLDRFAQCGAPKTMSEFLDALLD